MSDPPVISCDGLEKHFRGVHALKPTSFKVRAGDVLGVIGPNGSGKTTLLNCLSGAIKSDGGAVRLGGADISGSSMSKRATLGLARTFQNLRLFTNLSVRDNLLIGGHVRDGSTWRPGRGRKKAGSGIHADADAMLERLELMPDAARPAGALSYGAQRRVELGRALMSRPRALLLDEPAAGMNDAEVGRLGAALRDVATEGIAVIVIEHNVGFILGLTSHAIVLDAGDVIARGDPADLMKRPEVLEAYLG